MEPVWRTVAELDMPVAVHPGFPCPALDNLFNTVFDCVTVSFVFSQLIGFHTIMRSGLLDRYPNLRVDFMENGATLGGLSSPAHRGELRQEPGADHWRQARSQHARGCHGGSGMMRPSAYTSELLPEQYIERGQVFVNCRG